MKFTGQCESTVASQFVSICIAFANGTGSSFSFVNTGYSAFLQLTPYTASTIFNIEISGYLSLINGYIYAPCCFNNTSSSITFTSLLYSKFTIQTF